MYFAIKHGYVYIINMIKNVFPFHERYGKYIIPPALYETRKVYSSISINIECCSFKYVYSTQTKSWLTGILDERSSSPTVEFENIGIGLYKRLKKKEKKLYCTKGNSGIGDAVLDCKNSPPLLKYHAGILIFHLYFPPSFRSY